MPEQLTVGIFLYQMFKNVDISPGHTPKEKKYINSYWCVRACVCMCCGWMVMIDRGAITAGNQVKIKQFHGQSTFSLVSIRVKPHIPTARPSSNFTQQ